MSSSRTDIFRIAVDAAGDPDIIQLAEGVGPFSKITMSVEGGLIGWTLYAPNADSNSKNFSMGSEYVFQRGPYSGGDVLGYVELDSSSGFLLLFCEK